MFWLLSKFVEIDEPLRQFVIFGDEPWLGQHLRCSNGASSDKVLPPLDTAPSTYVVTNPIYHLDELYSTEFVKIRQIFDLKLSTVRSRLRRRRFCRSNTPSKALDKSTNSEVPRSSRESSLQFENKKSPEFCRNIHRNVFQVRKDVVNQFVDAALFLATNRSSSAS